MPVILDWDYRSKLADGTRIHNPNLQHALWGRTGTGDAEDAGRPDRTEHADDRRGQRAAAACRRRMPRRRRSASGPDIILFTTSDTRKTCTHLIPEDHVGLLRGDRSAGEKYFREHYDFQTYRDLGQALKAAVRERLKAPRRRTGLPADTSGFAMTTSNGIWSSSRTSTKRIHTASTNCRCLGPWWWTSERISAALAGGFIAGIRWRASSPSNAVRRISWPCKRTLATFATVLQAAVTYDKDIALLNAVFPNCVSTGGSTVVPRRALERKVGASPSRDQDGQAKGYVFSDRNGEQTKEYWADFRPVPTVTLEDIFDKFKLDRIDILKLDCEGSEFSILGSTTSLDRIGVIIGEYHGKESFLKLVRVRFADWKLHVRRDGDLGIFWLTNPAMGQTPLLDGLDHLISGKKAVDAKAVAPPIPTVLVAAMRNHPSVCYDLLLLEKGSITAKYEHPKAHLRGFARLEGSLWTIDSTGTVYRVLVEGPSIALQKVGASILAYEAHDLTVVKDNKLATASPQQNAVVLYDPKNNAWSMRRPWLPMGRLPEGQPAPYEWDTHHINSLVEDGDGFVLSLFSGNPKTPGTRWRDSKLDAGTIIRWGPEGFADQPIASGVYCPHSLRLYGGHVWWCDSFRGQVCRYGSRPGHAEVSSLPTGEEMGVRVFSIGPFTRGLTFSDGRCIVGHNEQIARIQRSSRFGIMRPVRLRSRASGMSRNRRACRRRTSKFTT